MNRLLIAAIFLCPWSARAVTPVFDLSAFYFSDSFTYSSASKTYGRTFYDLMIGMPVTSKRRLVVGWNYDSMSFTDNPETAETLSVTDMGPKILYYFDRNRTWVVGLVYNLITKGTYNPGGGSSEFRGSSLRVELGYVPSMTDNLLMGAKIIYYKASFTEEVTDQTTLTKTTNGRTAIYPAFAVTYRFD